MRTIKDTLKPVLLSEPTPAEQVSLHEVPVPQACPGWVLVKVKAFGLNHSEQILRLNEIQAEILRPAAQHGLSDIQDPFQNPFVIHSPFLQLFSCLLNYVNPLNYV